MTEGRGWTDAELADLRLEGLDRLTHLLSGAATDRDAAELVAWRMRSRAHEEAFRSAVRLRRLFQSAEGVRADGVPGVGMSPLLADAGGAAGEDGVADRGNADRGNIVPMRLTARRQVSRRGLVGGALAASFAGGAVMLGYSLDLVPSIAELQADYSTGTAERRVVQLGGGASVELNTRTSIDLRTGMAMPVVELIRGEALVTSGQLGGAALIAGRGTSVGSDGHFNARRDGDEVCITCVAGRVEVDWAGQGRMLEAHSQVRYNDHGIGAVLGNIDTAALIAWKAGTLIFRNMPMHSVIDEINRYRHGRVFLANARLAARPLSGTYYMSRLDEFFSQAELALGARVTHLPGNVVILS